MNSDKLMPLPFLPVLGKFDLNTYVPGSSDYEIMARVIETYNSAVSKFNSLLNSTDGIDAKLQELKTEIQNINKLLNEIADGNYADLYITQLSNWIDKNLQELVAKIVKFVWFELTDDGHFIAYIPSTWDFITFSTITDYNNPDYGKLALLWEE